MNRKYFYASLLLLLFLATILRIYALEVNSLWRDELAQLGAYQGSFMDMLRISADHMQPPLDYIIGWSIHRTGITEYDWGVRLPALIFGVGSLIILALWLKKFVSYQATLVITALVALCPFHVQLSVEARPYTIFLFFFLLTGQQLAKAVLENRPSNWIYYSVSAALLFLTRGDGPAVAMVGIGVSVVWLLMTAMQSKDSSAPDAKKILLPFLVSNAAVVVFVALPVFLAIFSSSSHGLHFGLHESAASTQQVLNRIYMMVKGLLDVVFGTHQPLLQVSIGLVGIVLMLTHLKGKTRPQRVNGIFFLLTTGLFAIVYVIPYHIMDKTGFIGKPGYLQPFAIFLLVGYGFFIVRLAAGCQTAIVLALGRKNLIPLRGRVMATTAGILTFAIVSLALWSFEPAIKLTQVVLTKPIRDQWREAGKEIAEKYGSRNELLVGIRAGYALYVPDFLGAKRYISQNVTTENIRSLRIKLHDTGNLSMLNNRNIHVSIMNAHVADRFRLEKIDQLPAGITVSKFYGLTIFHILNSGENGAYSFASFLEWLSSTNEPEQWIDVYLALAEINEKLGQTDVSRAYSDFANRVIEDRGYARY